MTSLQTKSERRYYGRGFSGGRGAFARVLDALTLRAVALLAAYLAFRPRMPDARTAALLALLSVLLLSVLLHLVRTLRYERYEQKEQKRIRLLLLARRLVLMDQKTLLALAAPLLKSDEAPALVLSAEPAGADALLALARAGKPCAVVAPTGFSKAAREFALSAPCLRLVPESALQNAAIAAGFLPGGDAVRAYIESEEARRGAQKKALLSRPFFGVAAGKYLVCALLLLLLSFFSCYALYCRMLSGLCMSLFAAVTVLTRTRARDSGIE